MGALSCSASCEISMHHFKGASWIPSHSTLCLKQYTHLDKHLFVKQSQSHSNLHRFWRNSATSNASSGLTQARTICRRVCMLCIALNILALGDMVRNTWLCGHVRVNTVIGFFLCYANVNYDGTRCVYGHMPWHRHASPMGPAGVLDKSHHNILASVRFESCA